MDFVKSWTNITNLLSLEMSVSFTSLQKNRLKNIFSFLFKDSYFWREIEKFFNFNLLGFSFDFIYEKRSILETSFLSIILFDIYVWEFDNFLSYLFLNFASLKNLSHSLDFDSIYLHRSCFKSYFPLKFDRIVFTSENLTNINFYIFKLKNFSSFVKRFFNCRYKNYLLFGFTSSSKFLFLIRSKVAGFLRSVLFFDVKEFLSSSNLIYFLGFDVTCIFGKSNSSFFIKTCKNQNLANIRYYLYYRLNLVKKKLLTCFLYRIRYELITNFFTRSYLFSSFLRNKASYRFWSFFFQLESSRCFRYYVVIFSDDLSYRWST